MTCLACGRELKRALQRAGSLRCQACRDQKAPLDARLVEQQRRQSIFQERRHSMNRP
jgi:hypothetical protein